MAIYTLDDTVVQFFSLIQRLFLNERSDDSFLAELFDNSFKSLKRVNHGQSELSIRIIPNTMNRTLTIMDNGVGMSEMDLLRLGWTASVSLKKLVDEATNALAPSNHHLGGCGVYSAYRVAHRVVVTTKRNDGEQYVWDCHEGNPFFTVGRDTTGEPLGRGTKVTLYLKDGFLSYLQQQPLKDLVASSGFTRFPVYLWVENGWLTVGEGGVFQAALMFGVIEEGPGGGFVIEGEEIHGGKASALVHLRDNNEVYKTVVGRIRLALADRFGV